MKFYKEKNFKHTEIGKIPKKWVVVRLGDSEYFEIIGSGINEFNGKKLYISTKCVDGIRIIGTEGEITFSKRPSRANMQPVLNSVWFAKMKNTIKVFAFTEENNDDINKYIFSTGFCGIKCKEKVAAKYLIQIFLSNFFNRIKDSLVTGSTQQDIKQKDVEKISVPLPSLTEQCQIAEVLSTIDQAIQKTSEIIDKTERLKKALMQHLLTKGIGHKEFKDTEIGKIPKEWEVVRFQDLCQKLKSGGTPLTSKKEYYNGNIPFVKIEDITNAKKYLSSTLTTITKEGLNNSTAWLVPKNSLLVAIYGSLGSVAINTLEVTTNQAILGIILKEKAETEFFYYVFSYLDLKKYAKRTTQANLTAEIIKNLKVPLPHFSEQCRIAEILSTLDKKLELEKNERMRLEKIKHGLMDLLLTGKIRVKAD